MSATFYIEPSVEAYLPEIHYTLKVWGKNVGREVVLVSSLDDAVVIGLSARAHLVLTKNFVHTAWRDYMREDGIFYVDGRPDFLGTAFYLLNSLQEQSSISYDELGRFRFADSYQAKFGNNDVNLVQHCFDEISKVCGLHAISRASAMFLTHDIDDVYGAIKEDGFNVLKKGRIDLMLGIIFRAAIGRPDWLNIDKIMKLESEYDCKSTFFWIMNQGIVNAREKNADYAFQSSAIQQHFHAVETKGFENGIHKSISRESFGDEIRKYGTQPKANRYHYLKFNLPSGYDALEEGGILLDTSLGFAEAIGFRNSYGLPFNPFNMAKRRPYTFVEAPLHIMDRTIFQYKKQSVGDAEREIITFFEKNKNNCVFSILWHNNFFTEYKFKGYLSLYRAILAYAHEAGWKSMSQQTIIDKYSIA